MKLREKSNPVSLSRDLHKFVLEKVRSTNFTLEDETMIYCCSPKDTVNFGELQDGTIVVPLEAINSLLYPFGLNKLLVVAEDKIYW